MSNSACWGGGPRCGKLKIRRLAAAGARTGLGLLLTCISRPAAGTPALPGTRTAPLIIKTCSPSSSDAQAMSRWAPARQSRARCRGVASGAPANKLASAPKCRRNAAQHGMQRNVMDYLNDPCHGEDLPSRLASAPTRRISRLSHSSCPVPLVATGLSCPSDASECNDSHLQQDNQETTVIVSGMPPLLQPVAASVWLLDALGAAGLRLPCDVHIVRRKSQVLQWAPSRYIACMLSGHCNRA